MHLLDNAEPGDSDFSLLLVEMEVVARRQIAADVYERDEGIHSHQAHNDWASQAMLRQSMGAPINHMMSPCPFIHGWYTGSERYPRGVADMVGYWVEGEIFGGVVLFDRGESDEEVSDEMLLILHNSGYGEERDLNGEWAAAAKERLKMITPSAWFGRRNGPFKRCC